MKRQSGRLAILGLALAALMSTGSARADTYDFQFNISQAALVDGSNIIVVFGGVMDFTFTGDLTSTGVETLTYRDGTFFPDDTPGTLTSPGVVNGVRVYTETSTPANPDEPSEVSFTVPDPTATGTYSGFGVTADEMFPDLLVDGVPLSLDAPLTLDVIEDISVCFAGPCTTPPPVTSATPEPSALMLLATGVVGDCARRRWMRR